MAFAGCRSAPSELTRERGRRRRRERRVSARLRRWALFGDFIAPIELVDPYPGAPTRRVLDSEMVPWAYEAHEWWALWVPSPRTAHANGWAN